MTFKKVGIAQDSNLRGDSVRVQNPQNQLAYSEFTFDGSGTQSYKLPSSAGTSGQVLQISSGTTLVWSTAVGPQGPIGPTGLPGSSGSSGVSGSSGSSGASGTSGSSGSSGANGAQGPAGSSGSSGSSGANGSSGTSGVSAIVQSYNTSGGFVNVTFLDENGTTLVPIPVGADGTSGSSGSSGQNGVNGAAGSSGSSGSSGANGVGGATMLGAVNFVPKYLGATALGTASITDNGSQIVIGYNGTTNAGGLVIGSFSVASTNSTDTAIATKEFRIIDNLGANMLTLQRRDDLVNTWIYWGATTSRTGVGNQYISLGDGTLSYFISGSQRLGYNLSTDQWSLSNTTLLRPRINGFGSATAPSLTWNADDDTGLWRVAANTIGFAAGGATAAYIDAQGFELIDGSAAAPPYSFISATATGMYRNSSNEIRFSLAGSDRLNVSPGVVTTVGVPFRSIDGTRVNPAYIFISGQNSGLYYITGATPQVGLSVQQATASIFGQTSSTIFSGGVANATFGLTNSIANQTFFNRAVNHTPVTAVATASYVMDMSQSNVFLLTLTASTTLDYTNAQIGSYVIVATQNATGNYSMSLASGKFQGATWSGVATASNAKTIIQVIYDGSKGIITSQKITDL